MPTTSRPDLLPLAGPTRIGFPYHGLITNGILDLGGGVTKNVGLTPDSGSSFIVSNPYLRHAITPTAQETADKMTWRTYAFWNNNRLGVTAISNCSYIYCDHNANWGIKVATSIVSGTKQVTANVYLTKLIGYFVGNGARLSRGNTETLLASLTFQALDEDGDPLTPFGISTDYWDDMLAPSPDGSEAYINFWYPHRGIAVTTVRKVYAVVKITVTGDGSLEAETLGQGISASLSLVKRLPELYSITRTDGEDPFQSVSGTITDGAVSVTSPAASNTLDEDISGSSYVETYEFFYCFDTSGNTIVWSHTEQQTQRINQGYSVGSSVPADYAIYRNTYQTYVHTISCGGSTVVTSTREDQLSQTCTRTGTLNGDGTFNIEITGYCSDLTIGRGLGPWDQGWRGPALFAVGFNWGSLGTDYYAISTYNDSLSFGSTDPSGTYLAYQPMTKTWAQNATHEVCFI